MEEKRDLTALDWVIGEISESLNQSRQALETYMGDTQDGTQLRFCLTHLHQVYGSLKMMELDGPTMLAEEMELLTQEMLNGVVVADDAIANTLMRSILQLPQYLQQIQRGFDFHSATVFPLVNELRSARGDSLIIDSVGFAPDLQALQLNLGIAPKVVGSSDQFFGVAKKLQKMFQFAAASALRGLNLKENRSYLSKVFLRLKAISQGSPRLHQWDIAKAWLDTLSNDDLASGLAVRTLMRHLHHDIKILATAGASTLSSKPNPELLRTLLFYVACSPLESEAINAVKKRYNLDHAFGAQDSASLQNQSEPELDTIRSVTRALKEELDQIKQTLEKFSSDPSSSEKLSDVIPVFQRVADTMSVMGVSELPARVQAQGAELREMLADNNVSPARLMDLAEQILGIEEQLEAIAVSGSLHDKVDEKTLVALRIDDAQKAVINESHAGLEKVKQSIVEYIASQWDPVHLEETPGVLKEIGGGLGMVPLQRASNIVFTAARYIEDKLLRGNTGAPQWVELDTLADAISSVEYYLERLKNGVDNADDQLLDVAEESLANLGFEVSEIQYIQEPVITEPPVAEAKATEASRNEFDQEPKTDALDELSIAAVRAVLESEAQENNADVQSQVESEPESLVDDDEDGVDDEIREIFIEEATEVIEAIDDYLPRWASDFSDQDSLNEFRRAFHTLKGSGRLVKAMQLGELAWSVESMLNRIIDGAIEPNQHQVQLIELVRLQLPDMVVAFERGEDVDNLEYIIKLQDLAERLSNNETLDNGDFEALHQEPSSAANELVETDVVEPGSSGDIDEVVSAEVRSIDGDPSDVNLANLDDDDVTAAAFAAIDTENALIDTSSEQTNSVPIDPELEERYQLWDIFVSEAEGHLVEVDQFNNRMLVNAPLYEVPNDPMQRALHTLKGSAHMAALTEVAEIATPLEGLAKEMRNYQVKLTQDSLQLFIDARTYLLDALKQISARQSVVIPEKEMFLARVAEQYELGVGHLIHAEQGSPLASADPSKLISFMAEGMDLLLDADRLLVSWRSGGPAADVAKLLFELSALEDAANQARLPQVATLSQQLHSVYSVMPDDLENIDREVLEHLEEGHERILDMLDSVAATQEIPLPRPELQGLLEQDAKRFTDLASMEESSVDDVTRKDVGVEAAGEYSSEQAASLSGDMVENATADYSEAEDLSVQHVVSGEVAVDEVEHEADVEGSSNAEQSGQIDNYIDGLLNGVDDKTIVADELPDDVDPEILAIFYEEADELLEEVEEAVHDWEEAPNSQQPADELKRILHTLKGGARLSGLSNLGDLAHDFETFLTNNAEKSAKDPGFFERIHEYQDRLIKQVKASPGQVEQLEPAQAVSSSVQPDKEAPSDEVTLSQTEQISVSSQAPTSTKTVAPAIIQRSAPQEVVKVPAELLESLVNLAGETSISRGRMEQQVSDWGMSLDEMNATILRLQEQLRRLDIETEAQILFRQEQLQQHEDFDPLEMDRYSQLQQLSRSLTESASDLMDLKATLSDKARDTEQLLLQQSRINTDLQEGLMRSRMVPFSRMVPRLRRIVRQVSTELNKQVNLQMDNVEGELDRSVLERIVTPLEHMLRNAVDHGMESAAERLAAGKPEVGQINLSLAREGGDVLLRLADDGRGIDLDKVRAKAIERGMMSEDAQLSDRDIMQFVVQAGFSTADSVTQISGRGVGLDVVSSEIKQLGGAVTINSQAGQGTEFLVRLPFTVSVNRALMVQIGDDSYALPLNTIEGIVRVSPFELEHYYQDPQSRFEYADENYKVRYLGEMLGTGAQPKLEDQILPLPVVLVRTAEHVVAIQVDSLMGSREIVVKSLGPQFASVQGLSGATVMGDGSVVVIIDPVALIRRQEAHSYQPRLMDVEDVVHKENDEITVMVVDDSVTVRKVASRFLLRQGYRVITAKDGIEALKVLQDEIPEIMLLDIEMPRMDGFEVAKNIRSSRRLRDLPIIMITSRTGQKHRDHAMELGVNKYMGKPYQEEALLENIHELIGIVPRAIEHRS